MSGKPALGFNEEEAGQWAKHVVWLELEVIKSYQSDEQTGYSSSLLLIWRITPSNSSMN